MGQAVIYLIQFPCDYSGDKCLGDKQAALLLQFNIMSLSMESKNLIKYAFIFLNSILF